MTIGELSALVLDCAVSDDAVYTALSAYLNDAGETCGRYPPTEAELVALQALSRLVQERRPEVMERLRAAIADAHRGCCDASASQQRFGCSVGE